MRVNMHVGDLKPDLAISCWDKNEPVDLTTALSVMVIGKMDGVTIFSRPATSVTLVGATSKVTMEWEAGDTIKVGKMRIAVRAVYPGEKPQTFEPEDIVVFERAV